ncbi:DUF6110 family protein [Methanosphaera sp.]
MANENNGNTIGYTQRAKNFLGKKEVKYFACGAVAAIAIGKLAQTKTAHNAAVSLTAGALNLKDSVEEGIENIKEDAEDIHAEAQEKQKIEIYGPEDVEEDDEE